MTMCTESTPVTFEDAFTNIELEAILSSWHISQPPKELSNAVSAFTAGDKETIKRRLDKIKSLRYRSQLEVEAISWLYDFIKANIKRGRLFDLREVLQQGNADCLGYARLFTLLGRILGLNAGVVEVVIDNRGRYVPHTAVMVLLSNHRLRFIDLWYGSKNIKHKRLGLQVKQGGVWKIEDIDLPELGKQDEVCYLPDSCVNAITLYIQGNRYLNEQKLDEAIGCYSKGIELYPGNARLFYNRAIAYENLGEHEKAKADYAQALSDDAAIVRVRAREHDEVTSLIDLDTGGIDDRVQSMYLLHKGFITGKKVSIARIAKRFGLSEAEVTATLSSLPLT